MNLRRIPLLGLLIEPTAAEHEAQRQKNAERLAEHHRQQAVEITDALATLEAQRDHHMQLHHAYRARLTVQPLHREKTRA